MRPIAFAPVRLDDVPAAVIIENAFNATELDRIESLCNRLQLEEGRIGLTGAVNPAVRKARVTWLSNEATWAWFYRAMQGMLATFNCHYRFEVWGFKEAFQYSEYSIEGQFNWHVDAVPQLASPRKLSVSLQLSESSAYEGGSLQIFGGDYLVAPRDRGTIICFPSHTLHRVTPVTQGLRKSIVCCAVGPSFR